MQIPRYNICKDHQSPFDFVYDAFVGKYKTIIAKANRSGGKTTDFAILDILLSLANNGCEIATLGAIQAQAQRCYRYVQRFIDSNPLFSSRIKDSLMSRTEWDTTSIIEVLVATVSGVNSPHPQKLFADEVELMNWFILQQAFNMVKSKGDISGQTVLGSTQKFVGGPMERLLRDGRASNLVGVYEWCIWEVMEKPQLSQVPYLKEVFGEDLPERVMQCEGYFLWEDLIDIHARLDKEIWETEWLCKRPQSGGLVYPHFSDENNMITNYVPDPTNVYIFEDYGYGLDNPDVVVLCNVDLQTQKVFIFDEIYMRLKTDKQIFKEIDDKLLQYGVTRRTLRGHVGDIHGLPETKNRFNAGFPMLEKVTEDEIPDASKLYIVRNGLSIVRKFIDAGWLKMTPNCTELRNEFMSYRKVMNPDGTYKEDAQKKDDHGPDAVRYGLIRLFPSMGFASFDTLKPRSTVPESVAPRMQTITGGIRAKIF